MTWEAFQRASWKPLQIVEGIHLPLHQDRETPPARLTNGMFLPRRSLKFTVWIRNEPIYERDYLLAEHRLDVSQHFGGKYVLVLGHDVRLNFIGTCPHEIAKWAFAPWRVYVLQVPLEFLDPEEIFIAILTGRPHPVARAGTFAAASGFLSSSTLSSSAGSGLGYVSIFQDHGTWWCLPRNGGCRIGVPTRCKRAALHSLPECGAGTKIRKLHHHSPSSIPDCRWLLQGPSSLSNHRDVLDRRGCQAMSPAHPTGASYSRILLSRCSKKTFWHEMGVRVYCTTEEKDF